MTHFIELLTHHTLDQLKMDALDLESNWPSDAAKIYDMIAERVTETWEKKHYRDLANYFEHIAACRLKR